MHRVLDDGQVLVQQPELRVPGVEDSDREGRDGSDESGLVLGELGQAVAEAKEGDGLAADPELEHGSRFSLEVVGYHVGGDEEHLEAVDSEDGGEGLCGWGEERGEERVGVGGGWERSVSACEVSVDYGADFE